MILTWILVDIFSIPSFFFFAKFKFEQMNTGLLFFFKKLTSPCLSPGDHEGLLQGGSGALHSRHSGGSAGRGKRVVGQGLLRAGLSRDEAADVPHSHEDPPGLQTGADQD